MDTDNRKYTSIISIVTAVGAFSVSGISVYCGYDLFRLGVETKVAISANTGSDNIEMYAVTPGIAFLLFGIYLSTKALKTLIHSKGFIEYLFEWLHKRKT